MPGSLTSTRLQSEHRMLDLWRRVVSNSPEFDLVLPEAPSFVCQASRCSAHCCKVFGIVPLGEREVVRLSRASGLAPLSLIECEDGEPLTHRALPPDRPYFLARSGGICGLLGDELLGDELLCSQYEGRPDACRVYPHYVFFFDPATALPVHADWHTMRTAIDCITSGRLPREGPRLVPLLVRHAKCPGFTGPRLRLQDWHGLLGETFRLQYQAPAGHASDP